MNLSPQEEKELREKPLVTEIYCDNGELSHWELINPETGDVLWSSFPEETIAMGRKIILLPLIEANEQRGEEERMQKFFEVVEKEPSKFLEKFEQFKKDNPQFEPPSPELDAGELTVNYADVVKYLKEVHPAAYTHYIKNGLDVGWATTAWLEFASHFASHVLYHHKKQWEERERELVGALAKIEKYSTFPTSETLEQRLKRLRGIAEKALFLNTNKTKT